MAEGTTDREPNSVEATINRGIAGVTGESSSCDKDANNNIAESSCAVTSEPVRDENLEDADLWMNYGSKAAEEGDYAEAADCYSRALEIRVSQFGELSPQCVSSYYKYGCALLYKSQAEADPLVSMPKNDGPSQDGSNNDSSIKTEITGESSAASVAGASGSAQSCIETPSIETKAKEAQHESDDEEIADGDEDESDLDLAWKMLDVARAIIEKHSGDTIAKVDILSALAEVALEREDVETSLGDYLIALSILGNLVEPDSRRIAELNFRICLCLEIGSKPEEAIPYCKKAISVCKSRVQRLMNEANTSSGPSETSCSSSSVVDASPNDTKAEIETLKGLCDELEKKLEDLQQLMSNPKSILSDILGIMSAKSRYAEKDGAPSVAIVPPQTNGAGSSGSNLSTTSSQVNGTSGVTHLGVVGRGVKRVVIAANTESVSTKRSCVEPPSNEDGKNS